MPGPSGSGARGQAPLSWWPSQLRAPACTCTARPPRSAFRIEGRSPLRDVRLYLTPRAGRTSAATMRLGAQPRGRTLSVRLTGVVEGRALAQGAYTVRIAARDSRKRGLRVRAGTSSTHELAFLHHRFPIAGSFSYGGAGSRFGSHRPRPYAIRARTWPPPPAPRSWRRAPARSRRSSIRLAARATTWCSTAGTRTATTSSCTCAPARSWCGRASPCARASGSEQVGSTGASSGPHLHFEIWTGGGWYTGGHPVDPLPYLRAWPR